MTEIGGKKKGNRHFHVRLTKGNEDENKKVKEDEVNMWKCVRKWEARGRGKAGEGESRIIVLEGQLPPSVPVVF